MIYIFLLSVLLIGCLRYDFGSRVDSNNAWFKFEFIVLVLVAGLRFEVGGDTFGYMSSFDEYPLLSNLTADYIFNNTYQPLWYVLNSLCKSIWNDFVFFQIVHACIVNAAVLSFMKKHTPYYFTGVLFYGIFYYLNFNTEILRASLAVSVFLFGYDYLKEKKWWKYLLVCLVAYGFHNEALVLLVLPVAHLVKVLPLNKKTIVCFLTIAFAVLQIANFVPIIQDMISFSEIMSDKLTDQFSELRTGINIYGWIMYLINLSPWVIIVLIYRNKERHVEHGLLLVYIFLYIQTIKYTVFIARSLDVLYPVTMLLLANALYDLRTAPIRSKNLIIGALVFLSVFNGTRYYFNGDGIFTNWHRYYPYHSVFNPVHDQERDDMMYYYRHKMY